MLTWPSFYKPGSFLWFVLQKKTKKQPLVINPLQLIREGLPVVWQCTLTLNICMQTYEYFRILFAGRQALRQSPAIRLPKVVIWCPQPSSVVGGKSLHWFSEKLDRVLTANPKAEALCRMIETAARWGERERERHKLDVVLMYGFHSTWMMLRH